MSKKISRKRERLVSLCSSVFGSGRDIGTAAGHSALEMRQGILIAALTDFVFAWGETFRGDRARMDAAFAELEAEIRRSYGLLSDQFAEATAERQDGETAH